MSDTGQYDVAIVGGGTMGTAAAWALVKMGLRPIVFEQFGHVHTMGSHSGETRIIRHAYAESPDYVPLVLRADQLWQELEAETNQQVLVRCGGLELAAPGYSHAARSRVAADEYGIPYEWLSPAECMARWPQFTVPEDWDVLYSSSSGYLLTEPAIHGMGTLARRGGATILEHAPVIDWGRDGEGVWLETAQGRYTAGAAIVTAGAWATKMLAALGLPIHILRKTLWWQRVARPEMYGPDRFPVFISDSTVGGIYGFPVHDGDGLKIANHEDGEPTTAESVDRTTRPGENDDVLELARLLIPGATADVVKSAVCLYAMTPDHDFILDRHPEMPNVAIGAGFSGHGFKFATAVGEVLAEMVTNPLQRPMPRLSLERFASASV